jgi:hypothetical protein
MPSYINIPKSRFSAVGIATGFRLDDLRVGVRIPECFLLHIVKTGSGSRVNPTSCPMCTGGSFSVWVKRPACEAD